MHSVWLMSGHALEWSCHGHGHLAYIPAKIFALQVSSQGFPLLHITKIPNVFLQRLPSSSKPESGWFLIAQMCNISPLTCPSTDGPNHPSKQQQPSCSCTPESFCQSPTDKVRMNEICAQLCCKEPSPPSKIRS